MAGPVTQMTESALVAERQVVEWLARVKVLPVLTVFDVRTVSEPVVAAAHEIGLPFFPGVATPSELDRARGLGCRVVKVFPVSSLGGPAFLRSVAAPYPGMRFIPTGGINDRTIGQYLELPSVLACGASWLCAQDLVAAGRFDEIRRRAEATLAALR